MDQSSRVVILRDDKVLFIHRIKNDKHYFVLPGGSMESGETPEQAAIREVKEETNLDIGLGPKLWETLSVFMGNSIQTYYFLVNEFNGELKLGGPEIERQSEKNIYTFEWLSLDDIKNRLVYPEGLKEKLIKFLSKK